MATLESDERNIIDAQPFNWRLIVYPLAAVIFVLVGGFGLYYYQLNLREQQETQARTALAAAKTPADMVKIADDFPHTTQAAVALLNAADLSFSDKDYPSALKDYQRVTDSPETPVELRDSAQLGLASVQEADGKSDQAIQSYLEVAHKGSQSPFAPVAYYQAAQIYQEHKDKPAETQVLQDAVRLGGDSVFVKQAASMLKSLEPQPVPSAPAPASSTAPVPSPKS